MNRRKIYRPLGLIYEYRTDVPAIKGFYDDHRFLSNFYSCQVRMYGLVFPSSEHAYMFHKSESRSYRSNILKARTPKDAKSLGRSVKLRPGWDSLKYQFMFEVLKAKFKDPVLRECLLLTGFAYLEETNGWGDQIWGRFNGSGENHLGRILMVIRQMIRDGKI